MRLTALGLIAVGVLGCRPDQLETKGPSLIVVDSILLVEHDSLYVGNPFTPVVDPFDGSIYIPDIYSQRVYRYARSGSLVRVYGRPGEGPGELRSASATFVLDTATLVVHDAMLRRLTLFDRTTGDYIRSLPFHGVAGTTPPVVRRGYVWFSLIDSNYRDAEAGGAKSIAKWDPSSDRTDLVGNMPDDVALSAQSGFWRFANQNLRGALAMRNDTLIRGWQLKNELAVVDSAGAELKWLSVPIVRRQGVPPNIRELVDVDRIPQDEVIERFSKLRQLQVLSDGSIAFTHHDQLILSRDPMPVLAAKVWVGLLSADFTRACVDTQLAASMDSRSMETFHGDTLLQLDRRIAGGTLQTWVRLIIIDPAACDWIDLREGR